MEEKDIENLTKKLMADSYTKLSDRAFSDIVMQKILRVEKRKIIVRMAFYFSRVMITSGSIIYFILQNFEKKIYGSDANFQNIPGSLWLSTNKLIEFILSNEYLILPLLIILVFKTIIDAAFKRRVTIL